MLLCAKARPLAIADERRAAYLGHVALYALPALVIAFGWDETVFSRHTVQ